MKYLITGGSGFIGTNLIEVLLLKQHKILNFDIKKPRNKNHIIYWSKIDILNRQKLIDKVYNFKPDFLIHLAARTDLEGKSIRNYNTNIDGVRNIIEAINITKSISISIFTSTKFVCKNGYNPQNDEDFCPFTIYGESKVIGEKIIRETPINSSWCIVRPSSIWGPWFDTYKDFFITISKKMYFNLSGTDLPRAYGFVGNIVYQILELLRFKNYINKKVFYLADYENYSTRKWADTISYQLSGKKNRKIPEMFIKILAISGDLIKKIGITNPPLTTFRLKNMRSDTSKIPMNNIKKIIPKLPYSLEKSVEITIDWMQNKKII